MVNPIREIEIVSQIGEDSYYIEYKNYVFMTYSFEGDALSLIDIPFEKWPNNALSLLTPAPRTDGFMGYSFGGTAIMKKNNDNTFKITYLSETNLLTDSEIEKLK